MGDEAAMNGLGSSLQGLFGLAGQLYNWDFSVFELHRLSGGRPLYHVTMALLTDQGLLDGWLLDRAVMEAYLNSVETMYKSNPYHNNTHAADVAQTAGVIMNSVNLWLSTPSNTCSSNHNSKGSSDSAAAKTQPQQQQLSSSSNNNSNGCCTGLSKLERFAIILASAVHDLGHPGVNNAFLVRTRDPQAVTYNDRSVNEMMHASLAFKLALESPGLNIFAAFSQEEYELVRKLVLEMVLSTDMDVHFALLKRYEDALAQQPDVRLWKSVEQRSLLFQMLVHLADLANPSRPWHLALKWAEWVVTEFLSQGEKEAAAGIPISPPCDHSKVCMPAAQLFFIERFMAPTLEIFRTSAPSFYEMAAGWLADTQAKWNHFKAAGVKFPHMGYPQLPAASAAEAARLWTRIRSSSNSNAAAAGTQGAGGTVAAANANANTSSPRRCGEPQQHSSSGAAYSSSSSSQQQQQQQPSLFKTKAEVAAATTTTTTTNSTTTTTTTHQATALQQTAAQAAG